MKSHREKRATKSKIDTVGVGGSIPLVRTIFDDLPPGQTIEIPSECEVIPRLIKDNSRIRMGWILRKKTPKTCERPVNKRSRSA